MEVEDSYDRVEQKYLLVGASENIGNRSWYVHQIVAWNMLYITCFTAHVQIVFNHFRPIYEKMVET